MSTEENVPTTTPVASADVSEAYIEQERHEKILKAKELYSHGSRNYLVKSYAEAADELSQVCALYEELYGELSDELGMPYLLYAKSLIALALDENKVIDVPDKEDDDDEDDDDEVDEGVEDDENIEAETSAEANGNEASTSKAVNGSAAKLETIKEDGNEKNEAEEADSTGNEEDASLNEDKLATAKKSKDEKSNEENQVSSTDDDEADKKVVKITNGNKTNGAAAAATVVVDGEKPSTSNGIVSTAVEDEENFEDDDAASSLQLAWQILELASKIFSRQGLSGLPNLAEVLTELANIEFENNILDGARIDYEKALEIYKQLSINYRRAMAELYYKIGLIDLMQQQNKEGAAGLKKACNLINDEIEEIKAKTDLNDKDKNNIQDMEETKQEIWAKIAEIEETEAQNVAEVRAALDSIIKPAGNSENDAEAGTSSSSKAAATSSSASTSTAAASSSSSSAAITSSSKPTDITHLIKRKKPEEPSSEAEAAASPAKRPAH